MASLAAPILFDCSKCGASLPVDGSTRLVVCVYCRTEMMLPDEIWHEFHPPAPVQAASPASAVPENRRAIVVMSLVIAGIAGVGGLVAAVRAVVGVTTAVSSTSVPRVTLGPIDPIAAAGDPCGSRTAACSRDGKAELRCGADGKMTVVGTCKGPNACRASVDAKRITCDVTLADVGDPCDVTGDACSTDHKSEVRCQAGTFAVIATCKGPDGCTLTPEKSGDGYALSCDDHVADVGDPCFDSERTACSSDKKALLTCTAQRFAVHHTCKLGCTVKKVLGTENKEMDCK